MDRKFLCRSCPLLIIDARTVSLRCSCLCWIHSCGTCCRTEHDYCSMRSYPLSWGLPRCRVVLSGAQKSCGSQSLSCDTQCLLPYYFARQCVDFARHRHSPYLIIFKDTVYGGQIPDGAINQQLNVLNQFFSGTGLSWRIAGVERLIRPDWYRVGVGR